jgi:hypothetical protein
MGNKSTIVPYEVMHPWFKRGVPVTQVYRRLVCGNLVSATVLAYRQERRTRSFTEITNNHGHPAAAIPSLNPGKGHYAFGQPL